MALIERDRTGMIPTYVVQVLHLVDPDDPVLAGEGFFERAELGPLLGETGASDAVGGLAGGEEVVEVVVGHFVPRLGS